MATQRYKKPKVKTWQQVKAEKEKEKKQAERRRLKQESNTVEEEE